MPARSSKARPPVTPRTGRPPTRDGAPHGEDEVRASLLSAAIELFAARGPGRVSVRQVAEAAGVNHGLVHYYFGSKDGLVAAALDQSARDVADQLASANLNRGTDVREAWSRRQRGGDEAPPPMGSPRAEGSSAGGASPRNMGAASGTSSSLFDAGGAAERHGRLLAHLILDADDPSALQTDYPTQRVLIDSLRAGGLRDRVARRRAAQVSALVLGWQLFGDFLTDAAGIDEGDRNRATLLTDGIDRLLG